MRLLIVSTPRSGNTWFRRLLSGSLDAREFAVHRPGDLDWANLPPRCVVQMHWRARPDVLDLCREFGFLPVVIVRHPLDVLISILHFCAYEPTTPFWLDGEGGDEVAIRGKDPTAAAFAAYATGERAAALLAASVEWTQLCAPSIRFEELVADPECQLRGFLEQLCLEPVRPLSQAIAANTLEKSRATVHNQHYWQGRPGIWRDLIGGGLADRIQAAHRGVFDFLGYGIEDARERTPEEIRRVWHSLDGVRRTSSAFHG